MRGFFVLFLIGYSSLLLAVQGEAARPLRVGMELSYPPFETICTDGKPCGFSVDIAYALGRYLNRGIVIENTSYIGLIPSLNNGKIDLIISSMTATDKRRRSIDFSEPYASTGLCLLASAKSPLKGIEDADKPGRIIVVKSGTTGELYAAKHLTKANVRVLELESLCVLEVVQGKADAFIYDQLSVYKNWQKNVKTTRALLTPFQREYWAVGIRKGNQALLEKVNQFIAQFRKEKGFEKLVDKYFPKEQAAFKQLGIPFIL